jgi:hydroxypyruvate isomerase
MENRRKFLKSGLAAAVLTGTPAFAEQTSNTQQPSPVQRKGRIRQSVSRWCYKQFTLDQLCTYAVQMGLKGIDLLDMKDWDVPHRYGLCRRRHDPRRT